MPLSRGRRERTPGRPRRPGHPGREGQPAPPGSFGDRFWDVLLWFDPAGSRLKRAARFTVGWAILGTLIMTAVISWLAWRTHGKPVEHLTVVAVDKQFSSDCNRFRHIQLHRWVVVWRSSDPPPGMPQEFTSIECRSWDVGRTVELVRVSGSPRTEVLAPEDGPVAEYVEGFAIAGAVVAPMLFLGRLGWLTVAERYGPQLSARLRRHGR